MSRIPARHLTDRIPAFDPIHSDWVLSPQLLSLDGLVVAKGVQSPHQIETTLTSHLLGIVTSDRNLQEITRVGDLEYGGTFPSGTGFLLPAHISYFAAWRSTDAGMNFTIDPLFLNRFAERELGLNQSRVELACKPFVCDDQIKTIANLFHRELATSGLGGRLYAESLRNLLSIHLLRQYCVFSPIATQPIGGLSPNQLQRVLTYIDEHLSESLHLSALAQINDMSESHFSRSFKKSTSIAPHQYVLNSRVGKAQQLLQQSQLSILEIALECGFAHSGHLSRHFKRIVGITPKQFRHQ
jgi:AraC family transcriptional regulator